MAGSRRVPAIKVRQWLSSWDDVSFDPEQRRRKPQPQFYLFSLRAEELKALSGIEHRSIDDHTPRRDDTGIQRRYDPERSKEIRAFVSSGYPLSEAKGRPVFDEVQRTLLKPGWLPTAIVVNILTREDQRHGNRVDQADLVEIDESADSDIAQIRLPSSFDGSGWHPGGSLHPIEVIDGQHRLWAFEEGELPGGVFELPVVAFCGLDVSWQAYLFWTINIKPKKINTSLAYDLYPLLRTENWLEHVDGPLVYRESRAQELTELMWSHPASPWQYRINMLGETGSVPRMVSQASWVRSLTATFLRLRSTVASTEGALFATPVGGYDDVIPWTRVQQAAFLIFCWRAMAEAVAGCQRPWAQELRDSVGVGDQAFAGPYTLLNTDQGVRGYLQVVNDLCCRRARQLKLADWDSKPADTVQDEMAVSGAVEALYSLLVGRFVTDIAQSLAGYDWRTSSAPKLSAMQRDEKLAFRGSSGYRILRTRLLAHLSSSSSTDAAETAAEILQERENNR